MKVTISYQEIYKQFYTFGLCYKDKPKIILDSNLKQYPKLHSFTLNHELKHLKHIIPNKPITKKQLLYHKLHDIYDKCRLIFNKELFGEFKSYYYNIYNTKPKLLIAICNLLSDSISIWLFI